MVKVYYIYTVVWYQTQYAAHAIELVLSKCFKPHLLEITAAAHSQDDTGILKFALCIVNKTNIKFRMKNVLIILTLAQVTHTQASKNRFHIVEIQIQNLGIISVVHRCSAATSMNESRHKVPFFNIDERHIPTLCVYDYNTVAPRRSRTHSMAQ